MYVYRNKKTRFYLIPKGLYVKPRNLTYNPFGIGQNLTLFSYKHIFPSGMCASFKRAT